MSDFDKMREFIKELQTLFVKHMERLAHAIDAVEDAVIDMEADKK